MVTIEMNDGESLTGKATGVDEHGALRVMSTGGERVIYSGEVSLRVADKLKQ
jgi:biotin-(acetyl-CoA carboxylase) ligase